MKGNRSYTGATERFWTIDGSTVFLKIDTEGDKARCAGSLFQYFTTRIEKAAFKLGRYVFCVPA